ncbi:MAG: RNA-binding S4 domain-containing protein [Clostridia bacterium]|nr:RNA-binding S4 domain-containing protein [Clostridia bacterium]
MREIVIDTDYIRLDAALKLADLVQSGGHAKVVITEEQVKVNGETCTMRGKKLREGDTATFQGIDVVVKKRKE